MNDLGLHRFEQRKTTILKVLDHIGETVLTDSGRRTHERALRFEVRAPGHGLATQGVFLYSEWYTRIARGWRRHRYQYDYLDRQLSGRFAYHWHAVGRRPDVHHLHCEERLGSPTLDHYRSYEMDLLEAHAEFAKLYASEEPIDCSQLRPLRTAGSDQFSMT